MTWSGEIGEPCLIPSGPWQLHAVVYAPPGTGRGNVCLVPALFEEKRSGHRVLVDFARALARAGWWVLHPDLAGSGNSPGHLLTLTVQDWVGNVEDGVVWLQGRSGVAPTVLVGVRAGALIAAQAAEVLHPPPRLLQLWQPVVEGGKYLAQIQTRRRIQDGLTGPEEGQVKEWAGVFDVDGFAVGPGLYMGLQELNLGILAEPRFQETSVQILQISARDRVLPDYQAFQDMLGQRAAVRVQVARPFWNPHTPGNYNDIIVPAVAWLSEED